MEESTHENLQNELNRVRYSFDLGIEAAIEAWMESADQLVAAAKYVNSEFPTGIEGRNKTKSEFMEKAERFLRLTTAIDSAKDIDRSIFLYAITELKTGHVIYPVQFYT